MKRRKLPSFKEHAEEHHKRTNAYVERHVSRLGEEMVRDTLRTIELLGIELSQDEALSLMDYPELRQPLLNIRKRYAQGLETAIVNGAVREWAESNNLQDLFVRRVLKERGQDERAERFIHYFKPNTEARNAFIKRKEQGLGLSDKVWNVSGLMQSNLEQALATAIEDGWDAVTLSKRVSQYLRDFPTMQRDYRLRYGRASRIEDAEYRSARLARTEINMAYRRAEQVRWADMDFVVGYEIKRSGRGYSCSVCDALAGKYPKDFVWHTWHPNCRCYAVPILNTDDEFFASPLEAKGTNASLSINEVTDTPEGFRSWLSTNEHRIVQARERGTLPYFIRHNPKYSSPQVKRERPKRTSEEAKAIQDRWDKRNAIRKKEAEELRLAKEYDVYRDFSKQGGGQVKISKLLSREDKAKADYQQIKQVAEFMARQGAEVMILPRIHYKSPAYQEIYGSLIGTDYERKCPDLLIDGKFYEFESYIRPWKKSKVRRMISHGLEQSPNIVIDNSKGCSHRHIKRIVEERIRTRKNGQTIREVWVYERGGLSLVYKHTEG